MWLLPIPASPSKAAMNFWCMTLLDSCVCFWDTPTGRILGAGRIYTLSLSTSTAAAVHMPTNRAWGTLSPTSSLAVGMIWFPVLTWISQITEDRVHWGLSWKLATTPWNASPVPPANTLNVRNTFLPCLTELKVVINLIYEFLIRSRLSINSNYRLFLQVNWGVGLGVSSCLHINICACTTTI